MRVPLLVAISCLATTSAAATISGAPAFQRSTVPKAPTPPSPPPVKEPLDPSIEDLEGIVFSVRNTCRRIGSIFRGAISRHRHICLALGGTFGLLHGHSVAFTVLFLQSFGASGWPLILRAATDFELSYKQAKENSAPRETAKYAATVAPLRQELVRLAAQLAALRRQGEDTEVQQRELLNEMRRVRAELESVPASRRAAPVLVAALRPTIVRDVSMGLWSGVTVSTAAACSKAARTIGVGVTLGEAVSRGLTALASALEPALRRALSVLPAEAVMLSYLGPSLVGSATLTIVGRSLGCWMAYRLQHLAAVLSVSLLSARLLVEAVAAPLEQLGFATGAPPTPLPTADEKVDDDDGSAAEAAGAHDGAPNLRIATECPPHCMQALTTALQT